MRIAVVDVPAATGGALSILKDFYSHVCQYEQQHEWLFIVSNNELKPQQHIQIACLPWVKKTWLHRIWFELFHASKIIKSFKADIIFSLQNTVVLTSSISQVLYVHQPLPFQQEKKFSLFKSKERLFAIYQHGIGKLIGASVKKADKVVVQTQWVKNGIMQKTKCKGEKIEVIPPTIEGVQKKPQINTLNACKRFFYPASAVLYKNHACLLAALANLESKGKIDYEFILTLNKNGSEAEKKIALQAEKLSGKIKFVGNLQRDIVYELFQECTLVFPSYIETFGLPLLEARMLGARIIASDCAFSHEILDGYPNVSFFDPMNPLAISALLLQCMEGKLPIVPDIVGEADNTLKGWGAIVKLITKNIKK